MTEYEYEVVTGEQAKTSREQERLQSAIDEMAADGWRLVDVVSIGESGEMLLIFEREVS